jgi:co-chaperonin GroES (HSP10)
MPLKPIGYKITVTMLDDNTSQGVYIPENAQRDDLAKAKVVNIGIDPMTGRDIETVIETGDTVWVPRQGLIDFTYNEKEKGLVVRISDCYLIDKK